jgi:cytochrome b subunit of formate dehydrogenase
MSFTEAIGRVMLAYSRKLFKEAEETKNPILRAYRMGLAQLVGELAVAIIITAILFGGIAGGIFFQACTSSWDTTSKLVWPYIFPIALTCILMGIIGHMYMAVTRE